MIQYLPIIIFFGQARVSVGNEVKQIVPHDVTMNQSKQSHYSGYHNRGLTPCFYFTDCVLLIFYEDLFIHWGSNNMIIAIPIPILKSLPDHIDISVWIHIKPIYLFGFITNRYRYLNSVKTDTDK